MAFPSSWLAITTHNLIPMNSKSSPRAGASSTQQLHPTTAKLMAKLSRPWKLPSECYARQPKQVKTSTVPTQGVDSSPAQRLMGRRTRTLLPTTQSLLEPRNPANPHEFEQLCLNQMRQAKYYNRSAYDLPVLKAGDTVRMKPFVLGQKSWDKAEVTRRLDGTTYRRNRQHLVKTAEPYVQHDTTERAKADAKVGRDHSTHQQPQTPAVPTSPEKDHVQSSPRKHHAGEKSATPSPTRTRSGRIIREPAKLSDYVRNWTVLLR